MAEMSERKLHNVVTEWKDGRHFMTTSRVHIFVWMLSGFDMANLKDLLVNKDFVEMILKVQDTTLNKATKKSLIIACSTRITLSRRGDKHPSP